jgi:putative tricarboxylic transport membrane protein
MRLLSRNLGIVAGLSAAALGLSACGPTSGSSVSVQSAPKNVQFIVDTGPGGGSDLFARQIIKLISAQKLAGNWPVVSQPAGGGLGAMAFLKGKTASASYISAFTSKWIIAALATPGAPASLSDLTPIAELADETQVIAAPANAPYDTMSGFVASARAHAGQLVQTGGSINSVDNLVALDIQKVTGTKWKYLSFDDGGPRITALLRGDAQIDVGAESDFHDQIAAGKLKLIGIIGDKRLAGYPNVSTLSEQGINLGGLPEQLQFRGIAGPPNMPAAAVTYYQNILSKVVNTPAWKSYLQEEGLVSAYATGSQLNQLISGFTTSMTPLVAGLPKSG